ncbi:hypothetical protein OS175_04225 [Marinicella sp. S1101]|uniref:hypothetical protein n=1 Tax=Marinicella marina TaxID=2996016 RepID=UPI002260828A|nr:hypothetical protein [Marinicella marina]MCX7553074.1 hypothetical protein [Marinicella marina]
MALKAFNNKDPEKLPFEDSYDFAIVGRPIDKRGIEAKDFLESKSCQSCTFIYNPERHEIRIDDQTYTERDFGQAFKRFKSKSVILETTTLNTGEVFLLIHWLKEIGLKTLDLTYVDPKEYLKVENGEEDKKNKGRRSFNLSEKTFKFHSTLPSVINVSERNVTKGVFFLGYEDERLNKLIDDNESIPGKEKTLVFGNPPFQPGWELNSYYRNIEIISRSPLSTDEVRFCGAKNPIGAIKILKSILKSLGEREKMFIAPIGTKPLGVASAIFTVFNLDNVGLLYDYPKKTKKNRTQEIHSWNIYKLNLLSKTL